MTYLLIFNDKEYPTSDSTWRESTVNMASVVPLFCLTIDCLLNRIRIPLRQIWTSILFSLFYIIMTYLYQT